MDREDLMVELRECQNDLQRKAEEVQVARVIGVMMTLFFSVVTGLVVYVTMDSKLRRAAADLFECVRSAV